ncbi:MAG: Ankyrin repeat-containing protein [candidate division TM6 bacterium GW2011_GWF2_38_10]|nr:MAG: Ankyrin repeat-containing protein [candidate division TM6 bacterium GW2011_GWF2_38_10]
MVGLLLEHGADVRVRDSNGATPLHILISTAQFFYAWGLGIKQKGVGYGYNIPRLPEVLTLGQVQPDFFMCIVALLCARGQVFDSGSTQGMTTPLHMAVDYGLFSLVKLLVDKGVDLNQRDQDGKTPLWYAIKNGHPVVVDFLQKHGAHLGID